MQESTSTEAPRQERCSVVHCGTTYTCSLPHCRVCGSHFDPGRHTDVVLCSACIDWAKVEAIIKRMRESR